jgi:hypothetical protein
MDALDQNLVGGGELLAFWVGKEFWESALSNLRKARDRVARRYNAGRRQADFRVGELVLLRLHR